jgi:hypothetical protein
MFEMFWPLSLLSFKHLGHTLFTDSADHVDLNVGNLRISSCHFPMGSKKESRFCLLFPWPCGFHHCRLVSSQTAFPFQYVCLLAYVASQTFYTAGCMRRI